MVEGVGAVVERVGVVVGGEGGLREGSGGGGGHRERLID